MFGRVYNVDPEVQDLIVLFGSLSDGKGAPVSQILIGKIKLGFPWAKFY